MKKKIIIIIAIIIVLLVLLIPIPNHLKDGGTIEYNAFLYKVTKYHQLVEDTDFGYIEGTQIKILGFEIYNNVKGQSNGLEYNEDNKTNERIVRIGSKLYYENKEKHYSPTCGTPDGYIKSHVSIDKIPTNNSEANFEEAGAFQFILGNSIALRLDNGWVVFEVRE